LNNNSLLPAKCINYFWHNEANAHVYTLANAFLKLEEGIFPSQTLCDLEFFISRNRVARGVSNVITPPLILIVGADNCRVTRIAQDSVTNDELTYMKIRDNISTRGGKILHFEGPDPWLDSRKPERDGIQVVLRGLTYGDLVPGLFLLWVESAIESQSDNYVGLSPGKWFFSGRFTIHSEPSKLREFQDERGVLL
jgi:hypothetical protein